jgi:hypothetical protein
VIVPTLVREGRIRHHGVAVRGRHNSSVSPTSQHLCIAIAIGAALSASPVTARAAPTDGAVPPGPDHPAAPAAPTGRPQLRVDVEPVAYILRGYSVHLRVALPPMPRLVAGLGLYGFDLPSALVELDADNRDEPWDVRLTLGYNAFVDYFFGGAADHGWEAGAQIGLQRYRAENPDAGAGAAHFTNLLLLTRVGYEWHPWRLGFYFFPWLGVGYTREVDGDTRVGDQRYGVSPLVPYGAVELGWRF